MVALASLSCALPAPANFGHAVATRKVTTNRHAPTDAETISESGNIVTLTVTEFQECSATGAQQSWQLSDESANQLQPIGVTAHQLVSWPNGPAIAQLCAIRFPLGGHLCHVGGRVCHSARYGPYRIDVAVDPAPFVYVVEPRGDHCCTFLQHQVPCDNLGLRYVYLLQFFFRHPIDHDVAVRPAPRAR